MELIFLPNNIESSQHDGIKSYYTRVCLYMKPTDPEIIRIGVTSGSDRRRLCDSKRFQYCLFGGKKKKKIQNHNRAVFFLRCFN